MKSPLLNWYPEKLKHHNGGLMVEWINMAKTPFTDPFFDESILKAKSSSIRAGSFKSLSEVPILRDWSMELTSLKPTAFIFHVSRCGSTLLSQLLSMNSSFISLAEVPFFDDILRLPFRNQGSEYINTNAIFKAALQIYGQKRTGSETSLFIKVDSWHVLFWEKFRMLYPEVPFLLLYRQPEQVIASNRKLPGMQAVPGVIEPEIFAFQSEEIYNLPPEEYMAKVLEKYYLSYLDICRKDSKSLLLNYNEGPQALLEKTLDFTGSSIDPLLKLKILERCRFHSKFPDRKFAEPPVKERSPEYLNPAIELYEELENIRKSSAQLGVETSPDKRA